jgi:hypothetical protein
MSATHGKEHLSRHRHRPRVLGFALRLIVQALRIMRPIQRESVAHKPIPKVRCINRTGRYRPAVTVKRDRSTTHRPFRDKGVKFVFERESVHLHERRVGARQTRCSDCGHRQRQSASSNPPANHRGIISLMAFSHSLGQKRKSRPVGRMSALPLKADAIVWVGMAQRARVTALDHRIPASLSLFGPPAAPN